MHTEKRCRRLTVGNYGHAVHSFRDTPVSPLHSRNWKTCAFGGSCLWYSALLYAKMAKCRKRLMYSILMSTGSYNIFLNSLSFLLILNLGISSVRWDIREKLLLNFIGRELIGTVNNKYNNETPGNQPWVMFHDWRGNLEFHRVVRLLQ